MRSGYARAKDGVRSECEGRRDGPSSKDSILYKEGLAFGLSNQFDTGTGPECLGHSEMVPVKDIKLCITATGVTVASLADSIPFCQDTTRSNRHGLVARTDLIEPRLYC